MGLDLSEDYLGVLKLWVMSIFMKFIKIELIINFNEFIVIILFL